MSDEIGMAMDRMYRMQRHFYDLTRKYYLFGRDQLIDRMDAKPGEIAVEVGCGTARNLIRLAKRYPETRFFGLDAASVMVETANAKLAVAGLRDRVPLIQAYAQTFTPGDFNLDRPFDRVLFSYTLSIIPGPEDALDNALAQLRPGGTLHVVDFGDQGDLPGWFRKFLFWWLSLFHVEHRPEVSAWFRRKAEEGAGHLETRTIGGRYAEFLTLVKS